MQGPDKLKTLMHRVASITEGAWFTYLLNSYRMPSVCLTLCAVLSAKKNSERGRELAALVEFTFWLRKTDNK